MSTDASNEVCVLQLTTAMSLAGLVGVDIPDIKLVELDKLDNLPQINLLDEKKVFAIKRFYRAEDQRN